MCVFRSLLVLLCVPSRPPFCARLRAFCVQSVDKHIRYAVRIHTHSIELALAAVLIAYGEHFPLQRLQHSKRGSTVRSFVRKIRGSAEGITEACVIIENASW